MKRKAASAKNIQQFINYGPLQLNRVFQKSKMKTILLFRGFNESLRQYMESWAVANVIKTRDRSYYEYV